MVIVFTLFLLTFDPVFMLRIRSTYSVITRDQNRQCICLNLCIIPPFEFLE